MDRYVLMTAARNEGRYIGAAIRSVLGQTVLPTRWVIVSDGSTDDTDEIVARHARQHPFIRLVRMRADAQRSFASQAHGLNLAARELAAERYDFIGCLDADITLAPDYFETILAAFEADAGLGVTGGSIHEKGPHGFQPRKGNSTEHVAGAVQMFRRECFASIGPFVPLPNGGLDTVAEIRAAMNGYRVASLPDLPAYHHRPTGGSDRPLRASYKAGLMDYEIGYLPLYEVGVCLRRAAWSVPVVGSLVRMAGFIGAGLTGRPRLVQDTVMARIREDQKRRMRRLFSPGSAAIVLLFFLASARSGWAAEYFVDYAAGSDASPGTTRDAPWKHAPGDTAAQGLAAAVRLAPGDVVTFRGSVVYPGSITVRANGTAEAVIRLRGSSWGTGRAIIDGQRTRAGGITLDGSYVRVEGFEIRNTTVFGIWHDNPWPIVGVQIVNNKIHDIGGWPTPSTPPSGNALYLRYAHDLVIQGDEHYNTAGDACRIIDSDTVTIRGNHFHDGQVDAINGGASTRLVIDRNTINGFQNDTTHSDAMQIMQGDMVVVSNNTLYDNTQDIYFDTYAQGFSTGLIYNNVVINTNPGPDGLGGFYNGIVIDNRYHPIGALSVYQNTFVDLNNGSGGFRNISSAAGGLPIGTVTIMNNIFFNSINAADVSSITVLYMDHNDYYDTHRATPLPGPLSLAAYQAAHPALEQQSIGDDPRLDAADGWCLTASSPAIDSGAPLPAVLGVSFAADRTGGPRPVGGGWDMGACEYGSEAARVPPAPSGLRVLP